MAQSDSKPGWLEAISVLKQLAEQLATNDPKRPGIAMAITELRYRMGVRK